MEITFLLGNGFDIQCGLKTSYIDFYKYILEKINDELGGVHNISHINPKEKIIDGYACSCGAKK